MAVRKRCATCANRDDNLCLMHRIGVSPNNSCGEWEPDEEAEAEGHPDSERVPPSSSEAP